MNDADLVTEVATALYGELERQDVQKRLATAFGEGGLDCDALATVAIASYLAIQQRLVQVRLDEMNATTEERHGE